MDCKKVCPIHFWSLLVAGLVLFVAGCGSPRAGEDRAASDHGSAEHGASDHAHADHSPATSIKLSDKALQNVGFSPYTVKLVPYTKNTTVPAMVVERPGCSQLDVTAPMTGVVTRVYPIEGQAVAANQPLFDLRLTHEDLVASQRSFLRSVEELDILERELARLKSISEGIIAGKIILDREYERQKIQAALHSQREALLLHGLSEEQVDAIRDNRKLLKGLTVYAPKATENCTEAVGEHPFTVQSLPIKPGEHVDAGQSLCILGDHCRLYIQGKAFEEDAAELNRATKENRRVTAALLSEGDRQAAEEELQILYLSDSVDPATRAFHFYMELPNKIIRDQQRDKHRFIGWKYKPGQRFEVQLPLEQSSDQLVLPVDAVVQEGAERFVFRQNGDQFDRVEVHVKNRDRQRVVIANDGSLYPGDIVAAKGAYQMYLAMKNKAGGPIDPHAGHSH